MITKIKFWQWPNILAIDAALVTCIWLWVFAEEQSAKLGMTAYTVLALSVWLTYIADRLFDVSPRGESQLLSARHKFAKRRSRLLWLIWAAFLVLNITLAITGLSQPQLMRGFVLLLFCLAYTGLNHLLSKQFFPKELIVALIFAGGTQVFLPEYTGWPLLAGLIMLCLTNCLMIAWKEKSVDSMLQIRSLSSALNDGWIYPLLVVGIVLALLPSGGTIVLLPPTLTLCLIHFIRAHLSKEPFRVLCDAALLTGPFFYFAMHKL